MAPVNHAGQTPAETAARHRYIDAMWETALGILLAGGSVGDAATVPGTAYVGVPGEQARSQLAEERRPGSDRSGGIGQTDPTFRSIRSIF
jgi:hypothetical protein